MMHGTGHGALVETRNSGGDGNPARRPPGERRRDGGNRLRGRRVRGRRRGCRPGGDRRADRWSGQGSSVADWFSPGLHEGGVAPNRTASGHASKDTFLTKGVLPATQGEPTFASTRAFPTSARSPSRTVRLSSTWRNRQRAREVPSGRPGSPRGRPARPATPPRTCSPSRCSTPTARPRCGIPPGSASPATPRSARAPTRGVTWRFPDGVGGGTRPAGVPGRQPSATRRYSRARAGTHRRAGPRPL